MASNVISITPNKPNLLRVSVVVDDKYYHVYAKDSITSASVCIGKIKICKRPIDIDTADEIKYIISNMEARLNGLPAEQIALSFSKSNKVLLRAITSEVQQSLDLAMNRRSQGIVVEYMGWTVYYPRRSVWVVVPKSAIGIVTALINSTAGHVLIDTSVTGGTKDVFKAKNLRAGLLEGIKRVHINGKMPYDINEAETVLDAAGITPDMHGILSRDTHAAVRELVQGLIEAAHTDGTPGLLRKLQELAAIHSNQG